MSGRCGQVRIAWICSANMRSVWAPRTPRIVVEGELIHSRIATRNPSDGFRGLGNQRCAIASAAHHCRSERLARFRVRTRLFVHELPKGADILLKGAQHEVAAVAS